MNTAIGALVNGALWSAAVAAVFWAVMGAAPRKFNAATRYATWCAALATTVLLPVCFVPLPRLAQPALNARVAVAPAPKPIAPVSLDAAPAPVAATMPPPVSAAPVRIPVTVWPRYLFGLWALVSGVLLLRLFAGWLTLFRKAGGASPAGEDLQARAQSLLAAWGVPRRVGVAASKCVAMPVAFGPGRPAILIPEGLADCIGAAELDQILIHEAAHLARRDDYAVLLQRSLEAIFPLHPVVRWLGRRIDLEREIACDDIVVATSGQPRSYAACLTRVLELCGGTEPAFASAGGRRSHLARRIDMLLDRSRDRNPHLIHRRLAAIACVAAALAWAAVRLPAPIVFAQAAEAARAVRMRAAISIPHMAASGALFSPQTAASGFEVKVMEDSSGVPLPSAELRLRKEGQYELAADLDTGRDGVARAAGLAAGDYLLEVVKPNFVTSRVKVHAPVEGLTLRLVRYGVISGQVMDERGKPVPAQIHAPYGRTIGGTRVAILAQSEAGQFGVFRETAPDEAGQFRVFDLPPGQYAVAVWYDGLQNGSGMMEYPDTAHPRIFTVSGGEEYGGVDFTIVPQSTFSVSGKVHLPNEKDQYSLTLAIPGQGSMPLATTLTEPNGSFRFERVPAGSYDLLVAGPSAGYGGHATLLGANPNFARTRVQVGQEVKDLDIAVTPARSANVVVRAHEGDKLPEGCPQTAAIAMETLEPWGILASSRPQATFGKEQSINGLAPGRYRFVASGLGAGCYQTNEAVADLSSEVGTSTQIEVASAGELKGMLKAEGGRPSDFRVVLLPGNGVGEARIAIPDSQWQFSFTGLQPGEYRIAGRPAAGAKARWIDDIAAMQTVRVRGGGATQIDLEPKGAAR